MYDTLFIDGVNLADMASCVQDVAGLYITPTMRGNNITIPGVDGEIYVDKPFESGVVSLQLVLAGNSTAQWNYAYRQLRTIVKPGKRVQLVRQLEYPGGYEQHVAYGEYLSGLEPSLQLARIGKLTLTMRVLSGLWYSTNAYSIGMGNVTVNGEARTRRITVTMAAGTLTNTTTNNAMTYEGTGTAVIDVENMTAYESGINTSQYLTWTGLFPMELVPGINQLIGSATLSYRAAYL